MKKIFALLLALCMVLSLAACGAKTDAPATSATEKPAETKATEAATEAPAAAEDITLTVWGPQEDQGEGGWLPTMCEKFNEAHPEWNITFQYGVCGENDAATKVGTDVTAAADVFMFASDQLGVLLQAQALAEFGGANLEAIKANNSEAMVNTVTYSDGGVYGVPFSPNTWFMYYNKNTYTEEDVKSLETMLEKGKVAFNIGDSWYLASFYVAAGGTLFGDTGADAAAGIQFGGENGYAATNYLVDLVAHPNFINDKDNNVGLGLMAEGKCDAYFSGTWKAADTMAALGDNYAAAQLPTITINGEQKQLRSFAGSKDIGVNPNTKNMKAATALAVFLGSEEAQLAHYEMRKVAPCHPALASNPTIAADAAVAAQTATVANTSIAQPSIPEMGNYWTPAGNMGSDLGNGTVTHDNAQEKTDAFQAAINGGL